MTFLRLNGVTDEDRVSMVAQISEAISAGGGWIEDHRAYSDLSLCLVFGVSGADLAGLWQQLTALPLRFDDEAHAAVAALGGAGRCVRGEITGTLEVRFTRGTGDLSRLVPVVPG